MRLVLDSWVVESLPIHSYAVDSLVVDHKRQLGVQSVQMKVQMLWVVVHMNLELVLVDVHIEGQLVLMAVHKKAKMMAVALVRMMVKMMVALLCGRYTWAVAMPKMLTVNRLGLVRTF